MSISYSSDSYAHNAGFSMQANAYPARSVCCSLPTTLAAYEPRGLQTVGLLHSHFA